MYVRMYVLGVMTKVVDKGLEGKGKDGRKAKAKEGKDGRGEKGRKRRGEGKGDNWDGDTVWESVPH